MNYNLVLISGKSATGKSTSLMNLKNHKGVLYLNCENNKGLPFKNEFITKQIVQLQSIFTELAEAEANCKIHTIVIDSLTYLMDMYESKHVLTATNTMKAWSNYAQFFKQIMTNYVAISTKNIIFTAHTADIYNDSELINETRVKVKGALMNNGIESYFSTVVSTKKVPLKLLENYSSKYLTYTDEEKLLGYKYCFQVTPTKETINESIRSSLGMWNVKETYINNDIQIVLNRIKEYYS